MDPATADTLERSPALRWVVSGSSALGLGGLLASLTVLQQSGYGLEFRWSDLAVPAFVGGAGADGHSSRRLLYAASGFLLLLLAVFLYPLRFVSAEKRDDVLIGLGIAAGALGASGEKFLRCCFATAFDQLQVAMERMARHVQRVKRG